MLIRCLDYTNRVNIYVKYVQLLRLVFFFANMSFNLLGVATTTLKPSFIMSNCDHISTLPIQSEGLIFSDQPALTCLTPLQARKMLPCVEESSELPLLAALPLEHT